MTPDTRNRGGFGWPGRPPSCTRVLAVVLAAAAWTVAAPGPGAAYEGPSQEALGGPVEPGPMAVTGRVAGLDGKPRAGAQVAVLVHEYRRSQKPEGTFWAAGLSTTSRVLGVCPTDVNGRFRVAGARYTASLPFIAATAIASAPGHGLVVQPLDHAAAQQDVTIELEPERVVRGRLIDLQGQPAVGVAIHVLRPDPAFGNFWYDRPLEELLAFWPKPVITDDKGRFLVRGLGRARAVLQTHHGQFAPQESSAVPADTTEAKEATFALAAARNLKGRVVYADSRKPAAGTRLIVFASNHESGLGSQKVEGRTDDQGRFALSVFAGDFLTIIGHPPQGTPGMVLRKVVPWAAAARQGVELSLPEGIVVRGTVTEQASAKPVAGARIQYRPRESNNPFYRREVKHGSQEEYLLQAAISGVDGGFELPVPAGPGHLLVLGPTLDYVHVETSWGELEFGKPGRERLYPDGLIPLDLKPGTKTHEVAATLRRGVTLRGYAVGPDGKPIDRFRVFCRSYIPTGYQWWRQTTNVSEGRDGRFELPGCDPDKGTTAVLLDAGGRLGAVAELRGTPAGGNSVTVRMEPCGAAAARFVDTAGKALANHRPFVTLVLTPGASRTVFQVGTDDDDKQQLEADWIDLMSLQPAAYENLTADAEGRVTLPNLIPAATYRILYYAPERGRDEYAVKGEPAKDFRVKAGETLQLGDITGAPRAGSPVRSFRD